MLYFISYLYTCTGTVGGYCAAVIFYFSLFYILFLYLPILALPRLHTVFLLLSVNQAAAAAARETTLCSFIRVASWKGATRRFPNEESQSGIYAAIHGGPLTSREGDLRVSMKIPAVAPRRGGRRKTETTDTDEGDRKDDGDANRFPTFGSWSVNSHDE